MQKDRACGFGEHVGLAPVPRHRVGLEAGLPQALAAAPARPHRTCLWFMFRASWRGLNKDSQADAEPESHESQLGFQAILSTQWHKNQLKTTSPFLVSFSRGPLAGCLLAIHSSGLRTVWSHPQQGHAAPSLHFSDGASLAGSACSVALAQPQVAASALRI